MRDVMIDLETLDTRASTVILSIGAVVIDSNTRLHLKINIDDQLRLGRTVSGRTLAFWSEQPDAARDVISSAADSEYTLQGALDELRGLIQEDDRVWGNGASFDISILEHAYAMLGEVPPWRFYNVRCFRTLKSLYPNVLKPDSFGTAHNALDDARRQAEHFKSIRSYICDPQSSGYTAGNELERALSPTTSCQLAGGTATV